MAVTSLTNAKVLFGAADLSGYSNNVELSAETEELDSTVFGTSGYKSVVGGLKSVSCKVGGLWESGGVGFPDDRMFTDLGVTSVPMTITPSGATVLDPAYLSKVLRPNYQMGGSVGELVTFESTAVGDGTALIRGAVADNQARITTGTTTVVTLTVPSATTRVYAAIHVLAVSGTATPTLTATLQGDDGAGFPSAATVAVGTGITAVGSQWLAGSYGVTADSFYRLSYVITGTNPSFTVIASIGVGA